MTTVEQFELAECSTRACREAETKRRLCRCACGGRWHGDGLSRAEPKGVVDSEDRGTRSVRTLGGVT